MVSKKNLDKLKERMDILSNNINSMKSELDLFLNCSYPSIDAEFSLDNLKLAIKQYGELDSKHHKMLWGEEPSKLFLIDAWTESKQKNIWSLVMRWVYLELLAKGLPYTDDQLSSLSDKALSSCATILGLYTDSKVESTIEDIKDKQQGFNFVQWFTKFMVKEKNDNTTKNKK